MVAAPLPVTFYVLSRLSSRTGIQKLLLFRLSTPSPRFQGCFSSYLRSFSALLLEERRCSSCLASGRQHLRPLLVGHNSTSSHRRDQRIPDMKGCRRTDAKVLGINRHRKFTRGVREVNQPSRNCGVPASRASMMSRPFATQVAP
jgi:hypothetical protein